MDRGDYILGTEQGDFTNAGMREPSIHTDYMMMVVVIHREGAAHNRRYHLKNHMQATTQERGNLICYQGKSL